jgi:hypothetical protein
VIKVIVSLIKHMITETIVSFFIKTKLYTIYHIILIALNYTGK